MVPSNNLTSLPWYESIEQQNARKWWVFGKVYPLFMPAGNILPFQIILPHATGRSYPSYQVFTRDGEASGYLDITATLYSFEDYDIYVCAGQMIDLGIGQYYLRFTDGVDTRYSEVFTAVQDISAYLRLQWYDAEDLVMDAGRIVYQGGYTNVVYLQADLAKPEYIFTEEVEERDGYTYPLKQISEKRYHFKFWASEYLLDALRFVRLSDYVTINYRGQNYSVDTFLLTPEWEDAGDVAAVTAEFDTATAVKKLGLGYVRGLRGDFNDDYNDDYDNIGA